MLLSFYLMLLSETSFNLYRRFPQNFAGILDFVYYISIEVNYINAHATSTIVGDLAEVNAIKKVFKSTSEIKMNATKFILLWDFILCQSMIGHCLGAAGGLEAIATVKAITTGWLHPTINQFNPEPSVEFDTVANKKQQHEVNVVVRRRYLEGPLAFCCEFPLLFCIDVWSMLCIFGNADVNCWDAIMLALSPRDKSPK
ncbi:3-oxoacyl-[acyl-carrier-protein] synthase I, chloroplastic [Vitis vinifera]|uniref:beta-ketoacyl-[acyl-carrier-protein] synthase I n=1 Tax=Vitis vinifera TaxID=29760 RepID=A0A438C081_VITVI|nr:3-oxoacyl-[acyl-carrier-protein] synthase I, chloroplastic [Vitis vinifera]